MIFKPYAIKFHLFLSLRHLLRIHSMPLDYVPVLGDDSIEVDRSRAIDDSIQCSLILAVGGKHFIEVKFSLSYLKIVAKPVALF